MADKKTRVLRRLIVMLALSAVAAVGALGWHWLAGLTCQRIDVAGARYAHPDVLIDIARVDTGMVLYDIEPEVVADRVRRHPWVREATVSRIPTGTLRLEVEERRPVVLALDAAGRPRHYFDREGYVLPLVEGAVFDVPLLRGLDVIPPPTKPVARASFSELFEALGNLDAETAAVLSDFEVRSRSDVWLYTAPTGASGAIPVRLGQGGYARKLDRLHAFWRQAVLAQPDKQFSQIDLRFDSQIVTREAGG